MEKSDRISELPLLILHKILAYLPQQDRGRIPALSKQWNSVQKSYPRLYYWQHSYMKPFTAGTAEYRHRLHHFLTVIDASLRSFTDNGLRVDSFLLRLQTSRPSDTDNGLRVDSFLLRLQTSRPSDTALINSWLPLALGAGVSEFYFQVLPEGPTLTFCPLLPTLFSPHKFFNLRELTLFIVAISDDVIRDVIRNCPNLAYLGLWMIRGVKRLHISKLDKLETFRVRLHSPSEVKSISVGLPSLRLFTCQNPRPFALHLASCFALNSLELNRNEITDRQLTMHVRRFSLLETLYLLYCDQLRKVRISLPRLKLLTVTDCRATKSFRIDAPALSKFTYTAAVEKIPVMSLNNLRDVNLVYDLRVGNQIVDGSWFVDLRRFLGDLAWRTNLTISFTCDEINFGPNVLGEAESPALVKVDRLDLKCLKAMDESQTARLFQGLLWSCHPKSISFSTHDNNVENSLLKVLCEILLQSEDRSCCSGTHFKCWRHDLIVAKIDFVGNTSSDKKSFSEIEYEQFRLALDQPSMFMRNKRAQFWLEWDNDTTPNGQ